MGRIVGGFATSHILFSSKGVEAKAENVIQGLLEIRARVRTLRPDVIVLAGSDHMNNFNLSVQVTLGVGIADEYTPLGEGGLPTEPFRGNRDFGEAFARHAAKCGFDLVQIEEVRPDHGMMTAKLVVDPENAISIVPVYINANMPVPPSPGRCYALGGVLRQTVEALRPADERVVVVGHGGLSHWLATTGQGRTNAEFDLDFMDRMIAGKSNELAQYESDEIVAAAGNGALELVSWLFMAGSLPQVQGQKIYYENMPEWITGMGGLALIPQGAE